MSRSFFLLASLALATPAAPAESLQPPPVMLRETKDRLPPDRMAVLVAGPLRVAERGDLPGAERAFDRLVQAARRRHGSGSMGEADLFTAFGVQLFTRGGELGREDMTRLSLLYIERTIEASKRAFGARHPQTALALHSYGDALVELHGDPPPEAAEAALAESYSIRLETLGAGNSETLAAMRSLARIKAARFRIPGKLDEAADLLRRAIPVAARSQPPEDYLKPVSLRLALVKAYADAGRIDDALREARIAAEEEARERTSKDPPCRFAVEAVAVLAQLEIDRPAEAERLRRLLEPQMNCLEQMMEQIENEESARN